MAFERAAAPLPRVPLCADRCPLDRREDARAYRRRARRARKRRRCRGESGRRHRRPDVRERVGQLVGRHRRRALAQRANGDRVEPLFADRIKRRVSADHDASRNERQCMVLDDDQAQPIRERMRLDFRKFERRWRANVRAFRAVDVLTRSAAREERERPQRRRDHARGNHGATFARTELGGVTFLNGKFGLLIRSSLPAGTRLMTRRPFVR